MIENYDSWKTASPYDGLTDEEIEQEYWDKANAGEWRFECERDLRDEVKK